jgi:hypothetical protein
VEENMTATTEPTEIRAGDTLAWTKTLSLYPATTYTLAYELRNSNSTISISTSASGEDHAVAVTAANTAVYVPGEYSWVGHVVDIATGTKRYTVLAGNMTVLADLAATTGKYDGRSYARRTLDAIEAVIENRASMDQQQYTIHDRQLSRMTIEDLFIFRDQFKGEVANEEATLAGTSAKRISTVF